MYIFVRTSLSFCKDNLAASLWAGPLKACLRVSFKVQIRERFRFLVNGSCDDYRGYRGCILSMRVLTSTEYKCVCVCERVCI